MDKTITTSSGPVNVEDAGTVAKATASTVEAPAEAATGAETVETPDENKDTGEIKRLRGESAKYRTRARDAEQAHKTLVDTVGRALGLITDEETTAPTVETLTTAVDEANRKIAEAEARATTAETQLAVLRAATKAGLDADLAFDSKAFTASLTDVDLSDGDAVNAHLLKWVQDHPHHALKSPRVGANTVEHAAGRGEDGLPKNQAEFDALTYGERQELYLKHPTVYQRFTR